jgi:hypothetical protein
VTSTVGNGDKLIFGKDISGGGTIGVGVIFSKLVGIVVGIVTFAGIVTSTVGN